MNAPFDRPASLDQSASLGQPAPNLLYETNELGQPVGLTVPDWRSASIPTDVPMLGTYCRVESLAARIHAADLFAANAVGASGANWTYLPYGPFPDLASYRGWVNSVSGGNDPLFFAVVDASTEHAIGVASYLRIDADHGTIEVGHINYSPLLQRSRSGTEAMYLMMRRVFEDWGYRRYEWKCNALNQPSRSAATRLGFVYEGTFLHSNVYKGRNRDTAWYAITDDNWPRVKNQVQAWLDPANFDDAGNQLTSLRAGDW